MSAIKESGVTDCACCGMHIMTDDTNTPTYCEHCVGPDCDQTNPAAWHCPTGECDGTGCDETGNHE